MNKLFTMLLLLVVLTFSTLNNGFAQDGEAKVAKVPNQTFGLGIQLQNPQDIGAVGTYAFTTDLHIGVQFGVSYDGGYDIGTNFKYDGGMNFNFAPFVKYFIESSSNFKPFISGGAIISSTSVLINSGGSVPVTTTDDRTIVHITPGAQWFPYKTVGVYAGFRFFEMDTDNSQMVIGIGRPVLGIDWWF
ncbi:MAG: hypothetical protein ACOVNU_07065 [Candidatus Kapaibacteriota bacterium]